MYAIWWFCTRVYYIWMCRRVQNCVLRLCRGFDQTKFGNGLLHKRSLFISPSLTWFELIKAKVFLLAYIRMRKSRECTDYIRLWSMTTFEWEKRRWIAHKSCLTLKRSSSALKWCTSLTWELRKLVTLFELVHVEYFVI